MRFYLTAILLLVATSSCEKIQLQPASDFSQAVCLNAKPSDLGNPQDASRAYNRLVFADEFEDRGVGSFPVDTPDCYDRDSLAVCKYRLDIGDSGICTKGVSHLKNLNKCRWRIWDGFSFWEHSDHASYEPSNVRVEDGRLKVSMDLKPGSEGPFKCGPTNRPPDSVDYYDTVCPIRSGGIDSEFTPLGRMSGINFKESRIEVRAKFTPNPGIWPAIWTWASDWRGIDGIPYKYQPLPGRNYGPEVDILESTPEPGKPVIASQTYVMWGSPEVGRRSPPVKGTPINPAVWHVFGVERRDHELRYYIDNCYTKVIRDGDFDHTFNKTVMVDAYASFLILGMGIQTDAAKEIWPSLQGALYEIDWVRVYEK